MDISRIATGYKCGLTAQVLGTRGSIVFDQERMNELRLYRADDATGRRGFRTILAGPEHPDYAAFRVAQPARLHKCPHLIVAEPRQPDRNAARTNCRQEIVGIFGCQEEDQIGRRFL